MGFEQSRAPPFLSMLKPSAQEVHMNSRRRFGAFHTYNQQPHARSFSPSEVDPLIIEGITTELSPAKSDNSGERYAQASSGDDSGETLAKWRDDSRKISTRTVEKPVEKPRFGITSF
jgi:hypothetical protein